MKQSSTPPSSCHPACPLRRKKLNLQHNRMQPETGAGGCQLPWHAQAEARRQQHSAAFTLTACRPCMLQHTRPPRRIHEGQVFKIVRLCASPVVWCEGPEYSRVVLGYVVDACRPYTALALCLSLKLEPGE